MDYERMSTADMLQYCNEALAWDDFGPIDIFFFESVKRIILGQCTPFDRPEDDIDDLMGIERPVTDEELAPDYDKYADVYYSEESEEQLAAPAAEAPAENPAGTFENAEFNNGFFNDEDDDQTNNGTTSPSDESFTVEA